jgi:hypothetical protein
MVPLPNQPPAQAAAVADNLGFTIIGFNTRNPGAYAEGEFRWHVSCAGKARNTAATSSIIGSLTCGNESS